MERRTKWIVAGVLGGTLVAGAAAVMQAGDGEPPGSDAGSPHRGDLVDRALAVGRLEPEVVVSVKSMLQGVVKRRFADVGEFVEAGDPLLEIQPTPTPLELAEARREVELRELELEFLARELARQETLAERGIVTVQESESIRRRHAEMELQVAMARDRLALLERGRTQVAQQGLETVVRAPVSGYILDKMVEIGDPIVPLSSFQAGTVLMTMADMDRLVFRGTVDEIDVGRLREGMPAEIQVGALPDLRVAGELSRIWLQSKQEENSTVFPIEIALGPAEGVVLRAGFSANAYVIVDSRDDVLLVPERLLTFEDGQAWVTVRAADGSGERRAIETGLSDAVHVEVVAGLDESDRLVEPARGHGR